MTRLCKMENFKLFAFILIRVLLKKKNLAKTFPLGTFGNFFILVEFEVHTPLDVGLYKTIPLIMLLFLSQKLFSTFKYKKSLLHFPRNNSSRFI